MQLIIEAGQIPQQHENYLIFWSLLVRLDGDTESVSPETVQMLLAAGAKLYCKKLTDEDTYFPPFREKDVVTATEAVVAIAEMMRAADLNTFDLAMWMSRPHSE